MKAIVDHSSRLAKMRAHTATHLLHSQLAKIFPHTKQAWSLVDEDYLRFDFNADRLLSPQEISEIEKNINQIIYFAMDISCQEMTYNQAIQTWAKAFFEDKYGDKVRVVEIRNDKWWIRNEKEFISIELCWWTHVENTKDIWCFSIVSQEAIASWIKRITALTWPKVSEKIHETQNILNSVCEKLWIKTITQLEDKLQKVMSEYQQLKSNLESQEVQKITHALHTANIKSDKNFDKIIKVSSDLNFKNIAYHAKSLFIEDEKVLIYNEDGNFLIITGSTSAKNLMTEIWLKWWWSDNMVQGRDKKIPKLFK